MTRNTCDLGVLVLNGLACSFSWRKYSVYSVINTRNGQSVAGNPREAETKTTASCTTGRNMKTTNYFSDRFSFVVAVLSGEYGGVCVCCVVFTW